MNQQAIIQRASPAIAVNGSDPVLLLSTVNSTLAQRSGYQVLADYLSEAEFVHAARKDPQSMVPWFFARVSAQVALTRYYLGGSAALEWKAWRRVRCGFRGVVHMMWADHDLGYLDLILRNDATPLCGTFHLCSDTIAQTIRYPGRLRRLAAIILMSESQRQFFLSVGVEPSRIHVVLHGVDADYFTPPSDKPVYPVTVLSVGNTRRNFPLLAQVCKAFHGDSSIRFQIVASPDRRNLFAGIPNVEFLCGLRDPELLSCYQQASLLLQTLENSTANNVVLEAMACGLPVVAERVGGISEYVSRENAILTEPNDVDTLVRAIRKLAESRQAREQMGQAARQRAEQLHWKNVANWTREVYKQAITCTLR